MVQLAVVAVLLVLAAVMVAPQFLKKEPEATSTTSDDVVAGSPAGATGTTADPAGAAATTAVPPADASGAPAQGSGSAPQGSVSAEGFEPGPGLPAEVVDAWKGGDAIALLVVKNSGIDDRLVRSSVAALSGRADVAVFVAEAKDVARYSRITSGVGVNRVPALVVVRPKRLSPVPEAQVSYGFRNSKSVVQTVDDAVYTGKENQPYHPE